MPKILRIINRLNVGGPTFNAAILTRYLSPEFETMLLSGMKDEDEESSEYILDDFHVKPIYIPNMRRSISPLKDYQSYTKICNIIKDFRPHIVHTHAAKAGTLGRLAGYACKVPVVLHTFHGHVFHSYFGKAKTELFIKIERYLAKRCTRIIAISEIQKKELTDVYRICHEDKVVVIPLGFDLDKFSENRKEKRERFRKEFLLDEDEVAVGIIGRLVPIKNHSLFVDAFFRLKTASSKKIKAFIIGDGEERQNLEQLLTQKGLSFTDFKSKPIKADVTFTSWRRDIDVVMTGLDIITLTSDNEGTPVSLIEAQAAGKPIATTNAGGVCDTVKPGFSAFVTPPGDAESLAHNLLQLSESLDLREKMGLEGMNFVSQKFHYQRLVEEMRNLYKTLLEETIINV